MVIVQIRYNPYIVKTDIKINGKELDSRKSPLMYVDNKRLQEWIEPKGNWAGIYAELKNNTGDSNIEIEFTGTSGDFKDIEYAKEQYGGCFTQVNLIHKNRDTAREIDPYQKVQKLKNLYQQLQDGPVDELKTDDIRKNFETAVNSEFRIVIVAPMSSGKSTLINAIIGRNLLPAMYQATTAVITEIKVNNQLKDFLVSAYDKYGRCVVEKYKATAELISDLNKRKDPDDPEGKKALIHRIYLEGPVPSLPSDILNTVFLDTPGGTFALNREHEEKMDEAINDENKSLILYVFNGRTLGTNDSNVVLQKIANTVRNSVNGKQSKDRFLFVSNHMDGFDPINEPYDEVIKWTILPQLESNGIINPNLFLTSAETARLVRMAGNGEKMTETEADKLESLVKEMSRSEKKMLPKYASMNQADKDRLMGEAKKYMEIAQKSKNDREIEENKCRAAEINSGIPAVELAIKEYLEKYAIAIKIKNVHDAFMRKVIERRMIDNCEAEWSQSKESFEAVKAELQEKRQKCDHTKKLKEFRAKVERIKLDGSLVKAEQARVVREIDDLTKDYKDKVKYEEAEYICKQFEDRLKSIGVKVEVKIDDMLKNGIRKSCDDIISEYRSYIEELELEGIFNIGGFNVKKTADFSAFDISKTDELLTENYITDEQIKVGYHMEKRKGIVGWFARLFGLDSGYNKVDDYEKQKYVKIKQLIQDQVTEIQISFDKEMRDIISEAEDEVDNIKKNTIKKLEGLDMLIKDLMEEIDRMLISQESLEKKVRENADKAKWIKDFVQQVEDLLTV